MSHSFFLTPHELKQIDLALSDHRPEVRRRAKALLLLHYGHTFEEVCKAADMKTRASLYQWIERWQQDGIDGLAARQRSGRPPLVSDEYCQTLEAITVMRPQDFGLDQP